MPSIEAFEHNGITIEAKESPAPLGAPGPNVLGWVVTAPDKHESIEFHKPYRVASAKDARLLDNAGKELGTGFYAASEVLKKAKVAQYFIVVPEGKDDAETVANIIGGVAADSGRLTGIAALSGCAEKPTLIAAPGFSHKKEVIDALVVAGKKLRARVVCDGLSTNTKAMVEFSKTLGGEDTGHERAYLVDPAVEIYSRAAKGDVVIAPSIPAMAAAAAVKPWESPGNQGVLVQDVARVIDYSITDKTTEGDLLNKHGISYFARTAQGGFSLIGNRSVTGKFLSFVGLEDTIARKLEAISQKVMAKNMTASFMEQEVRKLNLWLQDLVAAEVIPGGNVYLHPDLNTPERYKNGSWYIVIDYGRYSPNEHMIFHLNAVDRIVEDFIQGVL